MKKQTFKFSPARRVLMCALVVACYAVTGGRAMPARAASADLDLLMPAPLDNGKDAGKDVQISIKPPEVADPLAQVQKPAEAPADPLAWSGKEPVKDPVKEAAVEAAPAAPAPAEAMKDVPAAVVPEAPVPASAPVAATPAPVVDIAPLEGRISTLEKQMEELKKTIAEMQARPAPQRAEPVEAAPAPVARKPRPAKKKAAVKAPAFVQAKQSWSLRSAKPGVAWVENEKSGELRTVAVGETLGNLGRITGITQDSTGQWVILGTRGKMKQ